MTNEIKKKIRENLLDEQDKKFNNWGLRWNDDDYIDFIFQTIDNLLAEKRKEVEELHIYNCAKEDLMYVHKLIERHDVLKILE